jgi:hypothetical protein
MVFEGLKPSIVYAPRVVKVNKYMCRDPGDGDP